MYGYLLLNLFALTVLMFPPDLAYTVLDISSRSHCLSFAQAQKEAMEKQLEQAKEAPPAPPINRY
jgi:hypothetical protein